MLTRDWLIASRRASPAADYQVGLGRDYPAAHTRELPTESRPLLDLPRRDRASTTLPPFSRGDELKYQDLLKESETGEPASVCKPGKWEESYATMHREVLEGKRPPKLLTYDCDRKIGCGGLADR